MSTLSDAFAFFNTKLRNARLDLSTRSEADKMVVVALWRDRFDYSKRPTVTYSLSRTGAPDEWLDQPGNRTRLEDLRWAREHCEGRFRVVVIEAANPLAEPRAVSSASPQQLMVMKLTELDEETGEFTASAERVVLPPRPNAMGEPPIPTKKKGTKQKARNRSAPAAPGVGA